MWVRVDEKFPEHPKVVEAGRHLGIHGRGRVVALWTVGICYCNRNATDGFFDRKTAEKWTLFDKKPIEVLTVMCRADLLKQVDGGFQFHDYFDYQPSAAEIKAKRQKDKERKRLERDRDRSDVPVGVRADTPAASERTSARIPTRSRARDPDPIRKYVQVHRAKRAGFAQPVENLRVLKAVIWRETRAAVLEGEREFPDVLERVKVVAARAGLEYGTPRALEFLADQTDVALTRLRRRVA
jgi:hypothetical protein